jgi:hypothetical protein
MRQALIHCMDCIAGRRSRYGGFRSLSGTQAVDYLVKPFG